MAKILYDPRCEELARWFLSDPPPGEAPLPPDEEVVAELAGVIQQAIDDWNLNRAPRIRYWIAANRIRRGDTEHR